MKLSKVLGSRTAIFGFPPLAYVYYKFGPSPTDFLAVISIVALTFSQIILREGDADMELLLRMNKEQIKVNAAIDNSVIEP